MVHAGLALSVTTAKFFYTSSGVQNFLLASVERVAFGADVEMQLPVVSGSGVERVATATDNVDHIVIWMNLGLHAYSSNKGSTFPNAGV